MNHSFPQQVVIETTAACNQQCVFCGRTYMKRRKAHMPRPIFDRIVEEIGRDHPLAEVWPTFMGEAFLLRGELFDRLRHAREAGCRKITLNTNGTLLNDRAIAGILEGNLDRLIVSCDAHTPETHRKVRPGKRTDGLAGIYRGVESLLQEMRRRGLRRPIVEMQFSLFDENEHEIEAFTAHWLGRGVVVKTRPKLYWSGLVEGGGARVTIAAGRTACLWALDSCAVQWNGDVVMCPVDAAGAFTAGNVIRQSLQEIWNGSLRRLRELHLQGRFEELPELCRSCPDWQVKRAQAHFPDDLAQKEYEDYVRLGRTGATA